MKYRLIPHGAVTVPELVSVVIPAHNYARYLVDAIDSALDQGYEPVEVIVVDDGSTDETPAVLARYADRVHVIRLDGRGVAEARNAGLARAAGAHVIFLDADDLLMPGGLAAQAQLLAQRPDIDAAYGPWYVCDVRLGSSALVWSKVPPEEVFPRILLGNIVTPPTAMMVRRPVLEALGGFTTSLSFAADWDLWIRLARRGHRFGAVTQPVAIYRIHATSMSRNLDRAIRDVWFVLDACFDDPSLPAPVRALRSQAYFNMSLYLAKLCLEHGDVLAAQVPLQRALESRPGAADTVEFYYEIARGVWRHWQLETIRAGRAGDVTTAAEAVVRVAALMADGGSPIAGERLATIHLAVSLAARRYGAHGLARRYLALAARASWRGLVTRRGLAVASRLLIPLHAPEAIKRVLARVGLRRSPADPIPPLVSRVMASSPRTTSAAGEEVNAAS